MNRWLRLIAIAIGLMVATMILAESTKIGPVLIELTPQHGIHVGDLLVAILAVAAFVIVGRRLLNR